MGEPTLESLQKLVSDQEAKINELTKLLGEQKTEISRLSKENAALKSKSFPQLKQTRLTIDHVGSHAASRDTTPRAKRPACELNSSNDNSFNEEEPAKKVKPPPPITVHKVDDFHKLQELIVLNGPQVEPPTTTKTFANGVIKVYTHTADEYRRVIKVLKNSSYEYHHFQLPDERPYRIVIRGLHPTTDVKIITEDLCNLGHEVHKITNVEIKKKVGDKYVKTPLPLFFVDLQPKPNNRDIMNQRHLAHQTVRVEHPKRSREIPQCKRCQGFGHTRNYCTVSPRCVKCGLKHLTEECTEKFIREPKCVNYGGSHPANWKGCSGYQAAKNKTRIDAKAVTNKSAPVHSEKRATQNGLYSTVVAHSKVNVLQTDSTNNGTNNLQPIKTSTTHTATHSTMIQMLNKINETLSHVSKRLDKIENQQKSTRTLRKDTPK
jgi:uncharacterized coiled-coil protein SlyX